MHNKIVTHTKQTRTQQLLIVGTNGTKVRVRLNIVSIHLELDRNHLRQCHSQH